MTAIAVAVGRISRRYSVRTIVALVVAALLALVVRNAVVTIASHHTHVAPQSAAMEDKLGIRINRVAVVEDGGLVTLSYVVLDSDKAQRFQANQTNPPVITTKRGAIKHVSLMK